MSDEEYWQIKLHYLQKDGVWLNRNSILDGSCNSGLATYHMSPAHRANARAKIARFPDITYAQECLNFFYKGFL